MYGRSRNRLGLYDEKEPVAVIGSKCSGVMVITRSEFCIVKIHVGGPICECMW